MTHDAIRRQLRLAQHVKAELAETLPTPAARARWLAMLAEQIARADGKPVERFPLDPDSPEGAFLP